MIIATKEDLIKFLQRGDVSICGLELSISAPAQYCPNQKNKIRVREVINPYEIKFSINAHRVDKYIGVDGGDCELILTDEQTRES